MILKSQSAYYLEFKSVTRYGQMSTIQQVAPRLYFVQAYPRPVVFHNVAFAFPFSGYTPLSAIQNLHIISHLAMYFSRHLTQHIATPSLSFDILGLSTSRHHGHRNNPLRDHKQKSMCDMHIGSAVLGGSRGSCDLWNSILRYTGRRSNAIMPLAHPITLVS